MVWSVDFYIFFKTFKCGILIKVNVSELGFLGQIFNKYNA